MKIISLKLCNFRQFYGKTPEINFASIRGNTTIIHGNNGSGKTTLLNAFTWVLYEKFTAAFAAPQSLVNKRAITETNLGASIDCWAEIHFEHERKRYQLKRQFYACRDINDRQQYTQSKLFMYIAGDDGSWYIPTRQPEEIINNILPESLHQYFFFDGERIDRFFREDRNNNLAEDTKELLGVKVLDRSIEHLKKAKKTLEEELKILGDRQTKKLLQEQNKLEQELNAIKESQKKNLVEISEREKIKTAMAQRMLELSGAEELQKIKQQLETQLVTIRENLIEAKKSLKRNLSSRGYLVFLPEIKQKFLNLVERSRQQGELATGIKQQFIEKLLDEKICLCGTQLTEDTEPYHRVHQWLNKVSNGDIEEATIRLETQVEQSQKQQEEFWQISEREQATIKENRSEIAQIETQLDEIKDKLRRYPDEDVKQLQSKLDEVETAIKDLILEQGASKQKIEDLEKQISETSKQVIKQKIKEEKQLLAQKRLDATSDAIERLIQVRTRLENQFRYALEQRLQEIFSAISFTPYIPRLKENYELTLIENTSGIAMPVAASTGENQILSLSFIGAIIDRVREWSNENTLVGIDSSTFPIVMDSPFGSLDRIYRRQVAKYIPQIANQLIVLVTKTQWRGEVATEMKDYLGKEYVLVYNSPKPDLEEDKIEIEGKFYPLVQRSPNQFEYTEIIEVEKNFLA